ncbi:MAG: outer membrane beta-barrel protein [Verrucomicrobiota bacterium]
MIHTQTQKQTGISRTLCTFALACLAGVRADAQESIRPSGISSLAADARQEQVSKLRGHIMQLGPVKVGASVQMDLEVNDNVGLSEFNREGDLIFRPRVGIESEWQVTRLNTIRLGLSMGYAKYLNNSHLDSQTLLIDPGTQFAFDIFVGEHLRLNIHDRITIAQNPIDEATLSNVQRFARLQNSSGVTAFIRYPDWDFVVGYDHFIYNTLSSEFNYLDRTEEQFFASARHKVTDALGLGIEGSAALVNYEDGTSNDATIWTVGAFADATLSQYTKLRISAGYQDMSFDQNGTRLEQSNFGSWYANLSAAQRISLYLSHTLTVGREARLGLGVNFTDYVFARYAASWRMNDIMTWTFDAFLEDARDSGAVAAGAEHAFRYGGGAALAFRLSSHTSLALRYGYVDKDSNLALRSYTQHSGILSLSYQF